MAGLMALVVLDVMAVAWIGNGLKDQHVKNMRSANKFVTLASFGNTQTNNGSKVRRLYKAQKGKCFFCSKKTHYADGKNQRDSTATFDHLYDRRDIRRAVCSKGVLACRECNSRRGIDAVKNLYYDYSEIFDIRTLITKQKPNTQMNFTLTIGATPELQRVLEGFLTFLTSAKPIAVATEAPAAPVKTTKKATVKEEAKAETPEQPTVITIENVASGAVPTVAADVIEAENKIVEAALAAAAAVTLEEVRAAAYAKQQAGKKDGLKALLVKYDSQKVTGLKPEQYANFLKDVNAL